MSEHVEPSRPISPSGATDGLQNSNITEGSRLSYPFPLRISWAITASTVAGAALGISHGGQAAGLRFRAENAHKLPNTSTGWYLYSKSKNYNIAWGGVKEGLKLGPKVGFWTGSYFALEDVIDRARGRADFLSSVVAGLSISGCFSLWNRFPLGTAARTAKTGLLGGLAFGLVQDALGIAKGERPFYVDLVFGKKQRQEELLEDRA